MNGVGSIPDAATIRVQLERLLQSKAFSSSGRNSRFLTYLVERTLEGRADSLKERSVGVEVFGRSADYDTGADNVVRTAAGELRKRLAQYYSEPGNEREFRIELPPGSYVPKSPPSVRTRAGGSARRQRASGGAERVAQSADPRGFGTVLVAAVIWRQWPASTALDRFWAPVLNPPARCCFAWGSYRTTSGWPRRAAPTSHFPISRARTRLPQKTPDDLPQPSSEPRKSPTARSRSAPCWHARERTPWCGGWKPPNWRNCGSTRRYSWAIRPRLDPPFAGAGAILCGSRL